jgi:hypothetical protein
MQKISNLTLIVRLTFHQGLVHKDYLMHLYELFKIYGAMSPKITNPAPDKRTGKTYNTIRFLTYSLPCFAPLYELFYVDGKKVIPNNIAELLTWNPSLNFLWCPRGEDHASMIVPRFNRFIFDKSNKATAGRRPPVVLAL